MSMTRGRGVLSPATLASLPGTADAKFTSTHVNSDPGTARTKVGVMEPFVA